MDKQKLNNALKHAKITVREIQSDSMRYSSNIAIRPYKETNYHYMINIGGLSTDDMVAFMNWFKEVKPDWLEGIEQDYDDGWNFVD